MSLGAAPIAPYARLVSVITLGHGLIDSGRLLGIASGSGNPVTTYGPEAFWTLVAFALMRLIAAVGLWSYAIWGLVLVLAANGGELIISLIAPQWLSVGIVGFAVRLLILLAAVLLLAFERYLHNLHASEL